MRIVVIGGGIAGATAALALDRAGFEVVVHEAHPSDGADLGAFLTLADNGSRALRQVDEDTATAAAVAAAGFPLTAMTVLDDAGATVADVPLGEPGTPYHCLRRATLARTLRDRVRERGIPLRHGARLVALEEDAEGVTARFADGASDRGDLVLGADGLNSTVRAHVDRDAPPPCYAGQRVFYGYTADADPPGGPERITMVRGSGAAFGFAVSPAGEAYWFARIADEPLAQKDIADGGPARWRELLEPVLRADATPAADLVAATRDELMVTNAQDLEPGRPWRTARTIVLGDAAHAASPATGQGASMAMEDAVVLAKALRDLPDLAGALDAYERARRARVERNIAVSAGLSARRSPAATDQSERPAPGGPVSGGAVSRVDTDLETLLDWETPLSA